MITEGMDLFVENHILQYSHELETAPLHFVGSIAYHAQKYIEISLAKKGLKGASYVRRPIENVLKQLKNII